MTVHHPLRELTAARTKVFFREPEAIFWVYIFPIILMVGLGIAFRGGAASALHVLVTSEQLCLDLRQFIRSRGEGDAFVLEAASIEEARSLYAKGKADLIVLTGEVYEYVYDPSRIGATAAKLRVNEHLQAMNGRKDPLRTRDRHITEPGSRYVDWLIPGLLGMNIMGGGLWGLGFVTVDMRMRKLLKRFVATPMRRTDFLLALIISRLFFLLTEVTIILVVGYLAFGLVVKGALVAVGAVTLLGAACFSGVGLLLACRADKIETISGLLNVVMLPMWLFSGIFFSAERFPDSMQPLVQALPLTQLNNALRAVILEGASLESQWLPSLILAAYGAGCFWLALRWFRWQ